MAREGFRSVDETAEAFVNDWIKQTGQQEDGPLRFNELTQLDRASNSGRLTVRGDGRLSLALKNLGFIRHKRRWALGENPAWRWSRTDAGSRSPVPAVPPVPPLPNIHTKTTTNKTASFATSTRGGGTAGTDAPDLPPGALGTANGSGDQGPPPPGTVPENPEIPPPRSQPKEQPITMTDRTTTPRPPAETPAARGDDPLPPDTDPAQIERLRALPAAAGSQCSPLGKIRAMQTAFGLPLTSWNADKAAQRDAARATLAAYVDAA